MDLYTKGDEAYIARNYALAGDLYRDASARLDPFFDRIDEVFEETLAKAKQAFDVPDPDEAVRLYDLAVDITPGHPEAEAGLKRAQSLESVLDLTAQGVRFERDLEFDAAKLAFEKALELDALWEPAADGALGGLVWIVSDRGIPGAGRCRFRERAGRVRSREDPGPDVETAGGRTAAGGPGNPAREYSTAGA